MPELPDITVYIECLQRLVVGEKLLALRVANPFVLRTVEPPPNELVGRTVLGISRLGKRVVFELDGERFVVIHLMIAGRLRWRKTGSKDDSGSPARTAGHRSSGSATPTPRPTTAPGVRPVAASWQIVRSHDS